MIDDELPRDARLLLAAGRDRLGPDAATVTRLRARVEAAVIVGVTASGASAMAASATTAAPATAAASTATATTVTTATTVAAKSLALKLVVVAVGASAVGTSAYVAQKTFSHEEASSAVVPPQPVTPSVGDRDVTELQPPVAVSAPEPSPVVAAPPDAAPVAKALRREPIDVVPEDVPSGEPASKPERVTLTREIELVDRASIALRTGDLDAALAVLRTYSAETSGGGQLAQDAAALHIEVLCRTHAADAQAELAAFDKRWPRSAQRTHLTTICSEASK